MNLNSVETRWGTVVSVSISAGETNHVPAVAFSHLLRFLLSHVLRPFTLDHDEFVVLSLSPVRRNRRLFLFLRRTIVVQPSALGPVAWTSAQFSPPSLSPFFSSPTEPVSAAVAQNICHLPVSRRPRLVCHLNPDPPIPNGTDACRTVRPLISIPNVPIHLPTDPPEIIPGPNQPARIRTCLARPLDHSPERLEIFIDPRSPFCSGTRNRGGV
jgi:hypothetical protein